MYDTDRTKRSLSEFKGKNVVLAFVPGAFTGTCTTEVCDLRDQMSQFNSLHAEVLGISVDPPFSQFGLWNLTAVPASFRIVVRSIG